MRFAGDVLAKFDAGIDVPRRDFLELVGGDGTMDVHDPWMGGEGEEPAHPDSPATAKPNSVATEAGIRTSCSSMTSRRRSRANAHPRLGRDDAIAQAAAIEALYASADTGRSIELVSGVDRRRA